MNIYVSNFNSTFSNDDLKNLFIPYGEVVLAEVAIDAFTNQSRSFGYVDMPDEQQAQAAIAALNQSEVNGRLITVRQAESTHVRKGSYKVGDGPVNVYNFRNRQKMKR
jgi:RNA recognition motif-containing protein